jgi:citrate lyase subunit beta/citryl-CoA lyase
MPSWRAQQFGLTLEEVGSASADGREITKAKVLYEEACSRVVRARCSRTLARRGGRFMRSKLFERAEHRNGLEQPMRLLVNIETPRAVRLASELADAHPRVAGLQLGLTDLFESLRIDRQDAQSVHAGMFAVRLASGESGRFAYDSAFPDVGDEAAFRREAELARRMGYLGKSCVHPQQVAIANEIFRIDELQLEIARRIVAAARDAAATGRGAFLLDGRMIDLPMIKRAEACWPK